MAELVVLLRVWCGRSSGVAEVVAWLRWWCD